MSTNGRRHSRQRPVGPLGPETSEGPDPQLDVGGHGVFAMSDGQQVDPAQEAPSASASMYGLAADLAGSGPSPAVGPAGGPLAARPPVRLGAARTNRPAMPQFPVGQGPPIRVAGIRATSGASANNLAADPFAMAEAQRHPLPPGPDGEVPYGLALELTQDSGFPFSVPITDQQSERSRRSRRQGVARLGAPDRAAVAPSSQPGPLDPFTVMEMAANQEGLPEPDYGIVAELRNKAPPDPFASDFGLAAEVARRRSRSPSPLGRNVGMLPPLRARRRLDPVMAGSDGGFGLAGEIAARQRQDAADLLEPFGAAARAGELDPFALASEQLKVPRELIDPYEPSQQEVPGDDVRLKTPGDDASETSAVSRDDRQYGIADELGVDPATGRRQGVDEFGNPLPGQPGQEQAEPPGDKYEYNEDTGMITVIKGGQGDGGRMTRQYIEDDVTGAFYKLQSKRRKLFGLFRRKEPAAMEDDSDDEAVTGFRGKLRSTLVTLVNFFSILGMFAQGLLAGFALLNFYMTYLRYSSKNLLKFLFYYAPLALNCNRVYYSLLVLAVISSTSRLARDKLRNFQPRRLQLAAVDIGQLLLYLGAYVASVLCTPLDDELTYEWNRNPRFYELTFTPTFKTRLAVWQTLNIVRTVCVGLAWVLTCYQTCPYVFEATLRAELRAMRQQQALLRSMTGAGAKAAMDGRTPLKAA